MSSYVIPFVYKSVFSFLVVVALVRVLNKILFKILLVVQLLQLATRVKLLAMATHGTIGEYNHSNEDWVSYCERLQGRSNRSGESGHGLTNIFD